jgi:hypothetical protein
MEVMKKLPVWKPNKINAQFYPRVFQDIKGGEINQRGNSLFLKKTYSDNRLASGLLVREGGT